MQDRIGHIARPHAAPEDARPVGRVGLDGQLTLLQAHVEEGIVDDERRSVVGQVADVAPKGPMFAIDTWVDVRHEVGCRAVPLVLIVTGDVGGAVGLGLVAALRELVAPPFVMRGLVDGLCLSHKGQRCSHKDQKVFFHSRLVHKGMIKRCFRLGKDIQNSRHHQIFCEKSVKKIHKHGDVGSCEDYSTTIMVQYLSQGRVKLM